MCLFLKSASCPASLKNNQWNYELTRKFVYMITVQFRFTGQTKISPIKTNMCCKCNILFNFSPNKEERIKSIVFRTKYNKVHRKQPADHNVTHHLL